MKHANINCYPFLMYQSQSYGHWALQLVKSPPKFLCALHIVTINDHFLLACSFNSSAAFVWVYRNLRHINRFHHFTPSIWGPFSCVWLVTSMSTSITRFICCQWSPSKPDKKTYLKRKLRESIELHVRFVFYIQLFLLIFKLLYLFFKKNYQFYKVSCNIYAALNFAFPKSWNENLCTHTNVRKAARTKTICRLQNQIIYDVHAHGTSQSQARDMLPWPVSLAAKCHKLKNGLFRNIYLAKKTWENNVIICVSYIHDDE